LGCVGHVLALLCPGQGSQTPGMLKPWLDVAPVADRLRWSAAISGLDLVGIGTNGDDDAVRDTANAQPLLVALALATAATITSDDAGPAVLAGHSVGEFAAASLAGILTPEVALVLVRERGALMAAASRRTPTGMSAVLGGDPDDVLAALAAHDLVAANINGAGQVVAAGRLDALDRFAADPPAGARVRPLSVAGAFHTPFMETARAGLAARAAVAPYTDPTRVFISNADGAVVNDGGDVVRRLVEQVAAPVRWDLCMQTLADIGVTAVIELPPAGSLTGLVRRTLASVETLAVKTPDDLVAARALVERHAEITAGIAPAWRLAVAPVAGTFRPSIVDLGASVEPGAAVGIVVSQSRESSVAAVHGGVLVEWLAEDGDPVTPGQPIALLHPEPTPA
jgi:[acyl-carrier-protein] S-malonyltransferase